ncbi:hypothetical protein [Luteimonas sp. SDU101]|uniref:hypothetical protein n=1 Tax=unclassified Luteimonas TaxID=2629088 RepID=UPI003EC02322
MSLVQFSAILRIRVPVQASLAAARRCNTAAASPAPADRSARRMLDSRRTRAPQDAAVLIGASSRLTRKSRAPSALPRLPAMVGGYDAEPSTFCMTS